MARIRAVVVTGASTGIGEACALYLAERGFTVFAGVRSDDDAKRMASRSERVRPVMLDVTGADSIAAAAAAVSDVTPELAGLVNNAGIVVAGPLEFLPVDELRRQMEINVVGQIAVTQAFVPMLRAARGRIVNMGSVSGRLTPPFLGPYSASKFALEALTDALRMELRPWHIGVSIVEPGAVSTPLWEKSVASARRVIDALPPRALELYGGVIPRLLDAAAREGSHGIPAVEVAKVVAHALTSPRPKTRYVLGERARLQVQIGRFVPDKLRDELILRHGKLPR